MKHHKVNIYFDLFTTFFRIGAFTIGGGYAMLPLIERETINKGWLTKEEFIDSFTIAQAHTKKHHKQKVTHKKQP